MWSQQTLSHKNCRAHAYPPDCAALLSPPSSLASVPLFYPCSSARGGVRGLWRRSGLTYPKMACADPVTSGSDAQIQPTAEGGMSMGSADLIDGLVVFYLFLFINIGGHMLPL
jgi:hypothetical protein